MRTMASTRAMWPDSQLEIFDPVVGPVAVAVMQFLPALKGPDGNLYISTDVGGGSGAIWKVTPS